MSRRERLEQMGDRAKNFTNVYVKNFGEELDDEKLQTMMGQFGKIISARVSVCVRAGCVCVRVYM